MEINGKFQYNSFDKKVFHGNWRSTEEAAIKAIGPEI